MKALNRVGMVVFAAILFIVPVAAENAKDSYAKGKDAEARQNYEQAYDYYKRAYDQKPQDLRFRSAYERMKFQAAAAKVHRGQKFRDAGKLAEALAEFTAAVNIDPSSFIAQQEMQRTQRMLDEAQRGVPQTRLSPQVSDSVRRAAGPVELAPISQTPITLRLVEDAKVVYETIGKLAGINVLFDPDYTSRRIHIELNGVTLEQALGIVALESRTFWRPVTPNTVYIAQDSQAKRNELEQQVLRTFYLGNLSAPTEIQDVTNTLRTILKLERVQQLPTQNAIVVRGTPDQVSMAEKIIGDIDKARPEVVVEVAVMQVQRDRLRNLGLQPPFTTTSNPSIAFQNSNASSSTNSSTTTSTAGTITLNQLGNLNGTNFVVSIPTASVAALLNDSSTKVIENPQVRALDNQKALLKIGSRVPIATGSYSSTLTTSALVNTQFQYTDVGVNIEITPHIHMNRDVTLKISLEISAISSYSNIGGVSQPVIGQRKVEHEIRLREGEVNLLGGILEQSETQSMTGIPWLSQIPVLRYFFGQSSKERVNNEIVFALTPHVVRAVDLSDLNTRAIDIGTANTVSVRRHEPTPTQTPAPQAPPATAPVQPQVPQQQAPQSQPALPPQSQMMVPAQPTPVAGETSTAVAANAPMANPSIQQLGQMGRGPLLSFDPPLINQPAGATFPVNLMLTGGQNLSEVPAQIVYDPKLLELVNVSNGALLAKDGQAVALVHRNDAANGSVLVTATRPPGAPGVTGDGAVFTLVFRAKAAGRATIAVNRAMLRDASNQSSEATGSQAIVTIR